MIINRREVNPGCEFLKLIAAGANVRAAQQPKRETKFDQRNGKRQPAYPRMIVAPQRQKRQHSTSREEDQYRKQSRRHGRTIPRAGLKTGQKMTAISRI